MSWATHVLVFELFGNVFWRASADFDPSSTEDGASSKYECQIEDSMEWVCQEFSHGSGRGDVVCKTSDWEKLALVAFNFSPGTEDLDEENCWESFVEKLADKVELGD